MILQTSDGLTVGVIDHIQFDVHSEDRPAEGTFTLSAPMNQSWLTSKGFPRTIRNNNENNDSNISEGNIPLSKNSDLLSNLSIVLLTDDYSYTLYNVSLLDGPKGRLLFSPECVDVTEFNFKASHLDVSFPPKEKDFQEFSCTEVDFPIGKNDYIIEFLHSSDSDTEFCENLIGPDTKEQQPLTLKTLEGTWEELSTYTMQIPLGFMTNSWEDELTDSSWVSWHTIPVAPEEEVKNEHEGMIYNAITDTWSWF